MRTGRMRRAAMALLGATAAVGLAGCAVLGRARFLEPVVELKAVTITGLGLTGGNVEVELSVYNPNGYALDALRFTYLVDVDSVRLGTGALDGRFAVGGKDSSVVRLPVSFTYAGLGAAGRALLESGAVTYRVRGDFTVGTPIGNFTRPYDRNGRVTSVGGVRR